MSKKSKDTLTLCSLTVGLFILFCNFIGWDYFRELFIVAISFGFIGYLLFRHLNPNKAGWLSFILFIAVFGASSAGESAWHIALPVFFTGYLPGMQLGANARNRENTQIKREKK
ncbi:hypothetical protein [Rothia nasimurium]|uniref:hypothetical protein n=1 Tax=Rothia nasimurium TaxID=85336 RepID=UPI002DD68466|nr:hypothetical protein [Rothia nasimurium]